MEKTYLLIIGCLLVLVLSGCQEKKPPGSIPELSEVQSLYVAEGMNTGVVSTNQRSLLVSHDDPSERLNIYTEPLMKWLASEWKEELGLEPKIPTLRSIVSLTLLGRPSAIHPKSRSKKADPSYPILGEPAL